MVLAKVACIIITFTLALDHTTIKTHTYNIYIIQGCRHRGGGGGGVALGA